MGNEENKTEKEEIKENTGQILENRAKTTLNAQCSCGAYVEYESDERSSNYYLKDLYKEFLTKHQICPGLVKSKINNNES